MFNLTVDEVKELSKKYNMIPLTIECYADMDTPISVFKRMQTEKDCFLSLIHILLGKNSYVHQHQDNRNLTDDNEIDVEEVSDKKGNEDK